MPHMTSVESTSLEAVGYDADARELHVRFSSSGKTYVYYAVEEPVYRELMQAESKGAYVNRRIKPRYRYGRL